MAALTAIFELVDRMSAKLDAISSAGDDAIDKWEDAGESADNAFEKAQSGAQKAAEACEGVATSAQSAASSVGNSADEVADAGLRAQDALESEADSAEQAENALDDLEEQAKDTGDAEEDMGEKGETALKDIAQAIAASAAAKLIKEIAEAAYELVEAFDEAESVIVRATGASGEALNSLSDSMVRVYAASKTGGLEDTAAAVGEINTRLGYTGEKLEETTSLFLDFAAATGGNAASSVRSVTQLMRQWDIQADEMEFTLDKLTYAGQASGISVDGLTSQLVTNKAVLDELGFTLDQSIALFSQFELNGTQATSVMMGFRTALSSGAITSLEDLYEVFEQIASGEMDAAEAADIFGNRAGQQIVNAVRNGTFALDEMVGALEAAGGATVQTAETAQTLSQKWEQASNNIQSAFASALQPTVTAISSALAGVANDVGTFLNQHPAVVKALTAIGIGIGVVTAGIAAYALVTALATPVAAAFSVAVNSAIWPLTLIVGAIAAVTAAIVLFSDSVKSETADMTAETRENYIAVRDLTEEYNKACETYGETSEQASLLRYELQEAEAQYKASAQTLEEYAEAHERLAESIQGTLDSYEEERAAIHEDELNYLALTAKLEQLAQTENRTEFQTQQMQAVYNALAGELEGLGVSFDDVASGSEGAVQGIREYANAVVQARRQEALVEEYIELLGEQQAAEEQLSTDKMQVYWATKEVEAAQKAYNDALREEAEASGEGASLFTMLWGSEKKAYDEALDRQAAMQEGLDSAQESYDNVTRRINEIEAEWAGISEASARAAEEMANHTYTYEEACDQAMASVAEDVKALVEAYDEAYAAARQSIDGQVGLFDKMATESELSVQDMQAAFASQLEYLTLYSANLAKAVEYNLDERLVAALSDGSEESAGYLNAIITKVEELGGTSEEAQAFVEEFNGAFAEVEDAKDQWASDVAAMETDFDEAMSAIEEKMNNTIDGLNMDSEAASAAKATMEAYAASIRAGAEDAVQAAQDAADRVSAALSSASGSVSFGGFTHTTGKFATGTTDSPDTFIAGDDGPELILDHEGSTVFPADETRKVISAVSNYYEQETYTPPGGLTPYEATTTTGGEGNKKITLEIAGSGNIQVSGSGADKETIVAVMIDNLRPVLANILTEEIFEEGDGTYEY